MQGSFVRKRGFTWTAYYYLPDANGGRRQRSKGGFPTKAAAQAYLTNKVNAVQTGEYVETVKLTFGDYLTGQWLREARSSRPPQRGRALWTATSAC